MENIEKRLVISDLAIQYGQKTILSEVNLEFEKGKIYTIIGPNGSGKSSLIDCLSGDNSYTGSIHVEGKNLKNYSRKDLSLVLSKIQTNANLSNIRVDELIAMGRIPHTNFLGVLKEEDHEIIQRIVALTQIEELLKKQIHELSDGEKRKVFIAKALIQDCPIMLMDEPTTFLDIGNKFAFGQLLLKVKQDYSKTIFFSTHDLDLALKISDRILLIIDGKIESWSPQEVVSKKLLEQAFVKYGVKVDAEGRIQI